MDKYQVNLDFIQFINFLKHNNVATMAIAAVLSHRINEITHEFFDGFILPIINRDSDGDGVRDIQKFEEKECVIFGAKCKVGKFSLAVIKLLIITFFIYILYKIIKVEQTAES